MADDAALRALAAHRGLKLVKSRRRKPGGDHGRYGLRDAAGAAVFGIAADGTLTAEAAAIADWLHAAAVANWGESAGAAGNPSRSRRAAKPVAPPPSPPPPLPPPPVANLFAALPPARDAEAFEALFERPGVRIERIVSHGQATPADAPMVQDQDEWVVLLAGAAGLQIEGMATATLRPGDHLFIPRGQKHWVTWTASDRPSVWLAVHLE